MNLTLQDTVTFVRSNPVLDADRTLVKSPATGKSVLERYGIKIDSLSVDV